MNGNVKKRKKKLSKVRYGTSHTVSVEEAEHIYDDGAEQVIVGTGQHGVLKLSEEAEGFFQDHGCSVQALPTPDAVTSVERGRGPVHRYVPCDVLTTNNHTPSILEILWATGRSADATAGATRRHRGSDGRLLRASI